MMGWLKRRTDPQPVVKTDTRKHWSFCKGEEPGELVHFFRPGEVGRRHVLTMIVATLKRGGTQLLTVQDEGHMILRSYCHGTLNIDVMHYISAEKAVQVTLNCFEDPDNVASLTVWGYTEDMTPEEDDVIR
jgi:hypothetical protein